MAGRESAQTIPRELSGVAGLFFDGTSLPMVATIATASVAAFALSLATLRRKKPDPVALKLGGE